MRWLFLSLCLLILSFVAIPKLFPEEQSSQTQVGIGGGPEVQVHTIADITAVKDRSTLVGRHITLSDVPIQSVIDGGKFWVGTNPMERIFVVTGVTQSVVIPDRQPVPGNRVGVSGEIRLLPADADLIRMGVDEALLQDLHQEKIYLVADDLNG